MMEYFPPVAFILIALVFLAMVRLFHGPTPADRAVAVDTVNTLTVAVLILFGVVYRQIIFIDVAIVYALLSFVSTLFIAKYIGGDL
ncbi:MAG TPA: monovalent cation/H+ antiporter complex subunit F [Methanoregulaceae archaeon]|nr:MAG: cation:proton antiporter [Methanolinea sp.]HON81105.1 monovalent cation/H+ antiporter complex subunit F [Methanoregulaceae archaeon]HPD09951.1 monovalent cation/H+ antiporter complex subunit F [Methanoregulaceae archaeon]HRT14858.1 monovalent cation/H+ antiporter complex subunit F [Methanoregulaceae archaeon]HRU30527.1 monovalent cation/H+ antiporter complex subunit F [Methanoregulaceae archaeon]